MPESKLITGVTARLPDDWKKQPTPKKRSKYGSVKIQEDGYTFDSKGEAKRYWELKCRQQAGKITGLKVHPAFVLQEGFRDNEGVWQQKITYTADFAYEEDGKNIVEDWKSKITAIEPRFRMKVKMFKAKYPNLFLRIVMK